MGLSVKGGQRLVDDARCIKILGPVRQMGIEDGWGLPPQQPQLPAAPTPLGGPGGWGRWFCALTGRAVVSISARRGPVSPAASMARMTSRRRVAPHVIAWSHVRSVCSASCIAVLLLCEFARKKENPSLERYITPPLYFSLCTDPSMRTPHQRSQASRLNHLLFEVVAVATPQVAYSFVTKNLPALHTFDRAGGVAGTRRATKSQSSRCSCLTRMPRSMQSPSAILPILSLPGAYGGLEPLPVRQRGVPPASKRLLRLASGGLGPRHMSPRHMWSPGENRRESDRSAVEQSPQWRASCPGSPRSGRKSL